jgi:sphingomyelin phosphodiesterase
MIYYTGDTVDHAVWETTKESNLAIIRRVTNLFKEKFPGIPVYIAIGNHEAHPSNVIAPTNITDPDLSIQWLYDHFADSLVHWLPNSALETIRNGGYYTVLVKPGFRIAVLNNNDCYTFNWWLQYEQVSKARQLQWLHDLLLVSEWVGEKVHIITHMPSKKRSCYQVWSRELRRIIDRFAHIIPAQFNGHTHRDEFFIFYDRVKDDFANNLAWNGGSTVSWRNVS